MHRIRRRLVELETLTEVTQDPIEGVDRPLVPLDPDIANTLRDISDRIGDDFESSVASFEYAPTPEPESERPSRFSGASSAVVRRIMVGVLFAGAGAAAIVLAGPTILTWFEQNEPPAALAIVQEDGDPTQSIVVDGDTMYLEGLVPDQDVSDILESAAVDVVGRDRVVNNFEISTDAVYNPDAPIQLIAAEPVLFNTGAATLDEQYKPLIDLAVDLMEAEPNSVLSIVGHTDDVGPDDANLRLSLNRAEAVAGLVVSHGIDPDRLTVEGRGETEPLESNETPEGRSINRRVEFSIVGVFRN